MNRPMNKLRAHFLIVGFFCLIEPNVSQRIMHGKKVDLPDVTKCNSLHIVTEPTVLSVRCRFECGIFVAVLFYVAFSYI